MKKFLPIIALMALTASAGAQHFIGEKYGGGIVFYVYDGGQHGLIAAEADLDKHIAWDDPNYIHSIECNKVRRDGINIGRNNTDSIISKQGSGKYAAAICAQYLGGGFGDWYLPSKYELNLLYQQRLLVGGFGNLSYCSSTEANILYVAAQNFSNGSYVHGPKRNQYGVRAIRSF